MPEKSWPPGQAKTNRSRMWWAVACGIFRDVKVLIADDDAHVRAAIRLLLEQEAGVSSVSECASVDLLVDQVTGFRPDAVLIDWELPGLQPAQQARRGCTPRRRARPLSR